MPTVAQISIDIYANPNTGNMVKIYSGEVEKEI